MQIGYFFLTFTLLSSAIDNKFPKEIQTHNYFSQMNRILSELAPDDWSQSPDLDQNKTFRSPTKEFGLWVEVTTGSNLVLKKIKSQIISTTNWDGDCKMTSSERPNIIFSKKTTDGFSDSQLKRILINNQKAVIHIWSPDRAYSIAFFAKAKEVSEALGFNFFAVRDPFSDLFSPVSKMKLFSDAKSPLQSLELYFRDATIHFPMTFVSRDEKLSRAPIIGVFPNQLDFKKRILATYEDLK